MFNPDIAKFTSDPRRHLRAGRAFVALADSHELAEEEIIVDAGEMIDTLAFLTALVVEGDPAARTNQGLRLSAEEFAKRVAAYARAVRSEGERTGVPYIMNFGGTGSVVPMPDEIVLN